MKTAIYLRKSRAEEQENNEEILRRHKTVLLGYVESHELTLTDIYEEVVSGESLYARPEMLKLLEKVEQGAYDAVLCMDIDRLGRGGMQDQGVILDTFKYSDTKIITPDKTYDLNDDLDEEITEFKTFMSRREYKIITKRMRRGLKQTISEGCYVANAPYGYIKIYKDKKPTLEINEDEAKFVRMIFDMYCEGIGSATIANTINALGAKPHRSESFGRTSVMHILRNPTFKGKVVWDRKKHIRKGVRGNAKHITIYQPEENWTIVDGIHPAIISEEQFDTAQTISATRYIPPSNDGTVKSSLAGLVKCKQCGKNMQRMGANTGTPYLLCNTKGCCASAKFEYVEDMLIASLKEELAKLNIKIAESHPDSSPIHEQILQSVKNDIAKNQKQKDNLHSLLEQGVYDVDTYRERMKIIVDKQSALSKQEYVATEAIRKAKNEDKKQLAHKIQSTLDAYGGSDAKQRNQMLKSIIEKVEYYKAKKTKPQDFTLEIELKNFFIQPE